MIPEAPRIASATYPPSWDWNLLKADIQTAPQPARPKKLLPPATATKKPSSVPPIPTGASVSEKYSPDLFSPDTETREALGEDLDMDHDDGDLDTENDFDNEQASENVSKINVNTSCVRSILVAQLSYFY